MNAYRRGHFKLVEIETIRLNKGQGGESDSRGMYKPLKVAWSNELAHETMALFCPPAEYDGPADGAGVGVPPFLCDCPHGMGHGAFLVAVESLASEQRPFELFEVKLFRS